jgi:hypothetical protein
MLPAIMVRSHSIAHARLAPMIEIAGQLLLHVTIARRGTRPSSGTA